MPGSPRILGGLVLSVLVVGVLVGGSASGAGGPTLTAKLSKAEISFVAKTKLAGNLSGHAGGDAGRLVRIEASPFPYETFSEIGTVPTDASGRYSATLSPRLNTRYRARLASDAGVASRTRVAFVGPKKLGVRLRGAGPGKVGATAILDVWRNHPYRFGGRRLFFYFRKKGDRTFREVDSSRTRVPFPGRVRGKGKFRIPNGNYDFIVTWCFNSDRRDIGVGRPQPKTCRRGSVPIGAFPARATIARRISVRR